MKEEMEVQDPETQEAEGTPVENEDPEATPDEQDEVTIPEGTDKQEKPEPEPEPKAKKPYTPEELEGIVASDGQVDSERLTAEGILILKSFQRGYGKKFESLAEERRKLQEPKPAANPKDAYFQQYLANPIGTVQEINTEIQAVKARMRLLRASGDFEKADIEDEKATVLENLREEFAVRRQATAEQKGVLAEFDNAVLKAVPDIDTKVDLLTRFAQEELGYTDEELYRMTNVASGIPVATAVRNIATIDRLFNQANAAKTISKKVKKPSPLLLERGGTGGRGESKEKSPNDMSMEEFAAYMDKREKQRR